jgi:hypothetical protein
MDRILKGTGATIEVALTVDGTASNPTPDSATVTVTNAAGTVLVADAAATDTGTGEFSYNLTPTETVDLDLLTAVWTYERDGNVETATTRHEIVGGFLFSEAEFRAMGTAYANTTNYPRARIVEMRNTVEQTLEDACNRAFVPRYELETVNGVYGNTILTRWPKVRAVRSVTVDGTAAVDLSGYVGLRYGQVHTTGYWTAGYGNVTIGYEHGDDAPPERIRRAALILAKRWLTPGSADDRAINVSNDTGTYALFQAGVRGHMFDVPEVQAAVDQYSLAVTVV